MKLLSIVDKKLIISKYIKELGIYLVSRNKYNMSNTKFLKLLLKCKYK